MVLGGEEERRGEEGGIGLGAAAAAAAGDGGGVGEGVHYESLHAYAVRGFFFFYCKESRMHPSRVLSLI